MRLKRTISGLVAADEAASEAVRAMKIGDLVDVEIRKERVHKNLRRWWALCKLVYENTDQFRSPDMVHEFLKIRAGHCQQIVSRASGEIFLIADSIAFGRMDELQFQQIWKRAIQTVCEDIIPGIESEDIEQEILKCCGLAA